MIGTTISHYKILEKLGEGGMGVVYKAHDQKLDRFVALKFLPSYLQSDTAEKARFQHEARAASQLVHPNTTVLYEIGESGGQVFLAMEFIDGKTLRQSLVESSTLPLRRVLELAIQLAEGLQEAHDRGIVHRDIKPENIMITSKGHQAKITDFGLAKLKGATKLTKEGSTIGTVSYMSPEQARGDEVDHRTDIFSLGVVIYELITGHLPFRGDHQAAYLYSLINEIPPPLARYTREPAGDMDRILEKALAKEKEERYQHADELVADLRRERKKLEYGRTGYIRAGDIAQIQQAQPPTTGPEPIRRAGEPTAVKIKSRRIPRWIGGGVVAVIGGAVVLFMVIWPKESELNPDLVMRRLPVPFPEIGYPALSGDGKWIAFTGRKPGESWGLYFMSAIRGEPRLVTNVANDVYPDLSPDGTLIAYNLYNPTTNRRDLYVVSSLGGEQRLILSGCGAAPRFSKDGKRIGFVMGWGNLQEYPTESGKREFWSVNIDGTDLRREFVDTVSGVRGHVAFTYSPDDRAVAWIRSYGSGADAHEEIFLHDLRTHEETQVTFNKKRISELSWTRKDDIVFNSDISGPTNIWTVSKPGGRALQITKGSTYDEGVQVSRNGGMLVYRPFQRFSHLWIGDLEKGTYGPLIEEDARAGSVSFSHDGKRLAYTSTLGDDPRLEYGLQIHIIELAGRAKQKLTTTGINVSPRFSPDGRWIAYVKLARSQTLDTLETHVLEVARPSNRMIVGRGVPEAWIDSERFIAIDKNQSWLTYIDGRPQEPYGDIDSAWVLPLTTGRHKMIIDRRGSTMGAWLMEVQNTGSREATADQFRRRAKLLKRFTSPPFLGLFAEGSVGISGSTGGWWVFPDAGWPFLFELSPAGALHRISLVSGQRQRMAENWESRLRESLFVDFSSDGRYIVTVKQRIRAELVVIENVFR